MKTIVSDASPLIALARINRTELLSKLFDQVIVPPVVGQEVKRPDQPGGFLCQSASWLVEEPLASEML